MDILTDEDFKLMDALNDGNNDILPSYVIDDDGPVDILKTEIVICELCMHPNIISAIPFNRREKEIKQIRLDSVVYASLSKMAKLNKLDMNSLFALLIKVVNEPEVNKKIASSFFGIPKRKGKVYRSKKILSTTTSSQE